MLIPQARRECIRERMRALAVTVNDSGTPPVPLIEAPATTTRAADVLPSSAAITPRLWSPEPDTSS